MNRTWLFERQVYVSFLEKRRVWDARTPEQQIAYEGLGNSDIENADINVLKESSLRRRIDWLLAEEKSPVANNPHYKNLFLTSLHTKYNTLDEFKRKYPTVGAPLFWGTSADLHFDFDADSDLNLALKSEWDIFQQSAKDIYSFFPDLSRQEQDAVLTVAFLRHRQISMQDVHLVQQLGEDATLEEIVLSLNDGKAKAKPSNVLGATMNARLLTAKEQNNRNQAVSEMLGFSVSRLVSAYQEKTKKNPDFSVRDMFPKAERATPDAIRTFLEEIYPDIDASEARELYENLASADSETQQKALAMGQLSIVYLKQWEDQRWENMNRAVQQGDELDGTFVGQFEKYGEGLMDMIKSGSTMERASAIGILATLIFGFFGSGPLGKGKRLIQLGLGLGALEVAGQNIDGTGFLERMGMGEIFGKEAPVLHAEFLRRHDMIGTFNDAKHEVLLVSMNGTPMKELLDWRQKVQAETRSKGAVNVQPYKLMKDYPGLKKSVDDAMLDGVNMSEEQWAQAVYTLSNKLLLDIAVSEETSQISEQEAVLSGERYATEHYENKTFGQVLDIYAVQDQEQEKSAVGEVKRFLGDKADFVIGYAKAKWAGREDEVYALFERTYESGGKNLVKGLLLLLERNWQMTKTGAEYIFTKEVKGVSLELLWDDYGEKPVMRAWEAGKNIATLGVHLVGIPLEMIMRVAEGVGKIGDRSVLPHIAEAGAANAELLFLHMFSEGVGREGGSLVDTSLGIIPVGLKDYALLSDTRENAWYSEAHFGQFAGEVEASTTATDNVSYDTTEQAYFVSAKNTLTPDASGGFSAEDIMTQLKKNWEAVKAKTLTGAAAPVTDWNTNMDDWIIGNSIVDNGSGGYQLMSAFRIPTQPEKESAGERKGFDFVFDQQNEKLLNEEITITVHDVLGYDYNGQYIPRLTKTGGALSSLFPSGANTLTIRRDALLKHFQTVDNALWWWPDTGTDENAEEYRSFVQLLKEESKNDPISPLKNPDSVYKKLQQSFDKRLFS